MPKPKRIRNARTSPVPRILEPDAAGIDIAATEVYVAVPTDRDPEPIRCFSTFTDDLHRLADWLRACNVQSVAMESTGVFWIPLFQILEDRGFRVCLVNARHVKNVPGRKTDVSDCQWLQYLHSVGLLRASHRPAQTICAVRSIWRHRESLVQMAAAHIQHMQKALDQMNLQLHHVISDISGTTGLAIIDAILDGERNPETLAALRDPRIVASRKTIARALLPDGGRKLPRFPNAAAFGPWPGLCPDNRISGDGVLPGVTRKVKNVLPMALGMAAQPLPGSQPHFGQYFRGRRVRLGTPAAI